MNRRTTTCYVLGFGIGAGAIFGVVALKPELLDAVPASVFLVAAGLLSLVALSGDGCEDCESSTE